jgi:coenzyme F420-0:L-glutamate ligase / coenzyme F420-1:gamma-L-glutamate ligase
VTDLETLEKIIRGRRSVRHYRPDAVPPTLLEQMVEAASWAPSAGNRQDWEFVVVTGHDAKERMAHAVRQEWERLLASPDAGGTAEGLRDYTRHFDWFAAAPAVIVVSAKAPESFMSHLCGDDAEAVSGGATSAAMAAQNLMLAAHAAGLASCCLTGPLAAATALREMLSLGSRRQIVCLVTVGYPDESPAVPGRKQPGEIMRCVE